MPQIHKNLGGVQPGAGQTVVLYTVPAATSTMLYSLTMVNVDDALNADDAGRVYLVPNGGSPGKDNAILWDQPAFYGDAFSANISHMIGDAGATIRVYSRDGNISFMASGLEIS